MPITDEQALSAYLQSIEAEGKAEVCARHSAPFATEFERRYQAWRQANAEALAKGAVLAEAKGMNGSSPPSPRAFASMGAQLLDQLPEDDRQRRCDELLRSFIEAKAR